MRIHHANQAAAVASLRPGALVFEQITPELAAKHGLLLYNCLFRVATGEYVFELLEAGAVVGCGEGGSLDEGGSLGEGGKVNNAASFRFRLIAQQVISRINVKNG